MMGPFFLLSFCVGLIVVTAQFPQDNEKLDNEASVPCYDSQNRPQRCQPPFINAAYRKHVDATNTCGVTSRTNFCLQTGATGARKYCYDCNDRDPARRHPSSYLTDSDNVGQDNRTWWQSETMLEGIQWPTGVNLTLNLKKAFDITYVELRFYSPRPESFAIYKRTSEDGEWTPYQFYSASCDYTYNVAPERILTTDNEDSAMCSRDHSDISPLTGGNVIFSTLEGRPSMFKFNQSPKLQEWVTATDLKIVLTRMNTFGDEVFGDPQVLRSYFYAISEFAVGARCKCNGHARICEPVRGQDLQDRLECKCEHNTAGADCQECLPFYNDKPWGRATESDAHECQACDCNGKSDTCTFDPDLYRTTGHGGRCTNCRENRDGAKCELCKVNHYRRDDQCLGCGCNPTGSEHLQCDESGQCPCKPGVGGQRCERCLPDFYEFGETGCRPCACEAAGSSENEPNCDSNTGLCRCKENVDGRQCDKCKPGFFGLSERNPFGCISCFCYGHSSECKSASGFYPANITTNFDGGKQRWSAVKRDNSEVEVQYNGIVENIGVASDSQEPVYFLAPARYHGDHRYSYNQFLSFDYRIGEGQPRASVFDIILEGAGKRIGTHIFAQSNPMPGVTVKNFAFRIHENSDVYKWQPRLEAVDFIGILANLTALKIRATYSDKGVGFIDNINLGTARQGFQGEEAPWVESCVCRDGHIGQFCESCESGFKRSPPLGGPFARCVPCTCNNHSDSCDVSTGRCICQDNTEGDYCERCARGYYGDATKGNSDDCTACPCPNGGACIKLPNDDVVCTECEEGYGGNLCDMCLDGYYGDPTGLLTGTPSKCVKAICNGNIDPNAVGNVNTTTGECLKCIRNTGGFYCEQCLPDYYNNTMGQCAACNCYTSGTVSQPDKRACDVHTGQCLCLENVVGRQCDHCEMGYWDIASGKGCKTCECDGVGSTNYTCDETTGQCSCKPGVTGRKCDKCADYHYGHSKTGCKACNCDPVGSLDLQCDVNTGYCDCNENVDGKHCDRCMENKYDIKAGCLDCPQCYNLVQRQVNTHRGKLRELEGVIKQTIDNPSLFNDTNFVTRLNDVSSDINALLRDARGASTGDGTIGQQLDNLRKSLMDVLEKCGQITRNIASAASATEESQRDIKAAEEAIDRAEAAFKTAKGYIDREGRYALQQALNALENFGNDNRDKDMTEIAKKAAKEAKRQTEDAQEIEDLAKKALDTSNEAKRLASKSLDLPTQTRRDIDELRNRFSDASRVFQQTKMVANTTLKTAKAAKEEAIKLLTMAQQELPDIDVEKLKTESERIKNHANDIKLRAKNLVDDNKDLMMKVKNQTEMANNKLNDGRNLNQDIDSLLSEVDYARSEARKALEQAEKTLKEANDTLNTLKEFDKLTDNKESATQALKEVPAIRKRIADARDVTQEARDALKDVENDAKEALDLAREAKAKATEASTEAGSILKEAAQTKDLAHKLKAEADDLNMDVELIDGMVTRHKGEVVSDETKAKDALNLAALARDNAEKASDKVNRISDLVKNIKSQLQNIGTVDQNSLNDLEKLEKKLDEVENMLDDEDIDDKIKQLEKKSQTTKLKTEEFSSELEQLRRDVANIEEIKNSLPQECFKDIPIESTGA